MDVPGERVGGEDGGAGAVGEVNGGERVGGGLGGSGGGGGGGRRGHLGPPLGRGRRLLLRGLLLAGVGHHG